ncbi:hypothetical protein FACS189454_02730 [Planctomycetales bacterium]|nr:hypothetical protein FACS189454_02730 [Planctomycetales bacterium]
MVLTFTLGSFAEPVETEKTNSPTNSLIPADVQQYPMTDTPQTLRAGLSQQQKLVFDASLREKKAGLEFELQQTQRTLQFIDPNDRQLRTTLETQQAALTRQLKEIEALSQANTSFSPVGAINSGMVMPGPGISVPASPMPNEYGYNVYPANPTPPVYPTNPINPNPASPLGVIPPAFPVMPSVPPQQSGAISPWGAAPNRDLIELKYTVELLRKEIAELQQTVRDLNTQIQLLNRNFLNSEKK